jgi:hypothetical protein
MLVIAIRRRANVKLCGVPAGGVDGGAQGDAEL